MTVARALARHVVGLGWPQVPPEQAEQLKRFLFDYLGVAANGSQVETGRLARAFVTQLGGAEQATLIGQPGRFPAVHAAFANAISEHSIELDDIDELALFHYGPPVISAALAVAEWQNASGRELLVALLAGCDIFNRVSRATNNDLRDRGFHTTPTAGVFAAAAAASKLLGLDEDQTTSAFGLAGAQASGTMEMYGPSMQKRFNPGPAARNGVTAATMAQLGFTGTDMIFEGARGFGVAFAGRFDVERALERLGTAFPVIIEHKAYSAARPIHNAIDAALAVRRDAQRTAQEVTAITIRRHPDWAHYHMNAAPRTFHEAQVSLPYSVAIALAFGSASPADYREHLNEAEVRRLSQLVRVVVDPALARGVSCDVEVTYEDGRRVRRLVDYPTGSAQNPMLERDLRAKFDALTTDVLPAGAADRVAELVAHLEDLGSTRELIAALAIDR